MLRRARELDSNVTAKLLRPATAGGIKQATAVSLCQIVLAHALELMRAFGFELALDRYLPTSWSVECELEAYTIELLVPVITGSGYENMVDDKRLTPDVLTATTRLRPHPDEVSNP